MLVIYDAIFSNNQVVPVTANTETPSEALYLGKREVARFDIPGLPIKLDKATGTTFDLVIIPKVNVAGTDITITVETSPDKMNYKALITEVLKAGTKANERGNIIKLPAGLKEWVRLSYKTGAQALTTAVPIFAAIVLGVDDIHPAV